MPSGRITVTDKMIDRLLYPEAAHLQRPRTRGECADGVRPCPWVGCRHHLYLDHDAEHDAIRYNEPDVEPWDMELSCSLDVAEAVEGVGITLEDVGTILGLTRERIRQLQQRALARANRRLRKLLPPDPGPSKAARLIVR